MPTDTHILLSRILGVLGAATLVACAGRSTTGNSDDDSNGSNGSDSESGGTSESEPESESDGDSTSTTDEGEDTDEPILDMHTTGDGDGDPECNGLEIYEEFEWVPPIQCLPMDNSSWFNICFDPPEGVACESRPFADQCILDEVICAQEIGCGPLTTDAGACCYVMWGGCPPGRPWIVDGHARHAALVDDSAWSLPLRPLCPLCIDTAALDRVTRAALAELWASEGLSEHASVASFTRFTLQLLALAAPAALIEASTRAKLDEVRHAQTCFALASAYAGAPIGPAALDIRGGLDQPFDLTSIALSLAAEGCIAETVSAILIAAARDRARDPVLRAALAAIARDEVEHVLLAWEALAWMCQRARENGARELEAKLAAVFCAAEQHVALGPTTTRAGDRELRAHGYLSLDERRAIAARALAEVVAPAARELFTSIPRATRAIMSEEQTA
jgi:hypothetical protein